MDVPCDIFPKDTGLIVADAFGAEIVCEAPEHRLHAATRRTMTLSFARARRCGLPRLPIRTGRTGTELCSRYCGWMPAALASSRFMATELRTSASNSAGVISIGSPPSVLNLACTSGFSLALRTS